MRRVRGLPLDDGGVAGELLVRRQRRRAEMHQRVEPADAAHHRHHRIDPRVAALDVDLLMREDQLAFVIAEARIEIVRRDHARIVEAHNGRACLALRRLAVELRLASPQRDGQATAPAPQIMIRSAIPRPIQSTPVRTTVAVTTMRSAGGPEFFHGARRDQRRQHGDRHNGPEKVRRAYADHAMRSTAHEQHEGDGGAGGDVGFQKGAGGVRSTFVLLDFLHERLELLDVLGGELFCGGKVGNQGATSPLNSRSIIPRLSARTPRIAFHEA